jgi:hypothetical protein
LRHLHLPQEFYVKCLPNGVNNRKRAVCRVVRLGQLSPAVTVVAIAIALHGPGAQATETRNRLTNPSSPSQNVIIENTGITIGEFWQAYTSDDTDHRRRAELFLLGVLDATEGVTWCGYGAYKTITIDERLYSQLKKLNALDGSARAARVIGQVLSKSFPCGSKN